MRLMPLITAVLVTIALYFLVIERETLLAFAQATPPDAAEDAAEAPPPEAVRVVALRSTAQMIDSAVVLRGRTEAARQVAVQSEISGLVISEPLRKGQEVTAGQIICELDPGPRQAQLDEAEARLAEARAQLPEAEAGIPAAEAAMAEARARKAESQSRLAGARAALNEAEINYNVQEQLFEDGFASETRLANAEAALESARAALASAEAQLTAVDAQIISADAALEGARAQVQTANAAIRSAQAGVASAEQAISQLTIRAPFTGLLETDSAELGTLLQPGGLCATVIQLDPIKVVGFVPEADVFKVRPGAPAMARLPGGDLEVTGTVSFLARVADEQTRTFRTEITVPNPDQRILDGLTADILISSDGQAAHLVPQSALTLDDDGALGLRTVTEDSLVQFLPATLLRDTVDGVWLTGLPETVDVIVVGQEFVTDGVLVAPTYRGAAEQMDMDPESQEGVDG